MMQMETALGAKLRRAGFEAREVRFQIAVAEFLNNGGSIDRAHELIAIAADKMESGGQRKDAGKAVEPVPPLRTDDAKGFLIRADKASASLPKASPHAAKGCSVLADKADWELPNAAHERNGAGRTPVAAKADTPMPASVSAKPTPRLMSEHARKAMTQVAKLAAKASIAYKLADGRDIWTDVKAGELRTIAVTGRRDAIVASLVRMEIEKHHPGGFDELKTAKELLVGEDQVKQIAERAKELSYAA